MPAGGQSSHVGCGDFLFGPGDVAHCHGLCRGPLELGQPWRRARTLSLGVFGVWTGPVVSHHEPCGPRHLGAATLGGLFGECRGALLGHVVVLGAQAVGGDVGNGQHVQQHRGLGHPLGGLCVWAAGFGGVVHLDFGAFTGVGEHDHLEPGVASCPKQPSSHGRDF